MRPSGFWVATLLASCLCPPYVLAQNGEQHRGEPQFPPYHQHHDTRHGHDHFYPDRGAVVRDTPQGAMVVAYAGLAYRFQDGIWYEPRGPAFMVVAPPIGVVVPSLPPFATVIAHSGELYLYANDAYYKPRPDLSGYEVVNDPAEPPLAAAPESAAPAAAASGTTIGTPAATATPLPAAVTVPLATAAVAAAPAAATSPVTPPAFAGPPPAGMSTTAATPGTSVPAAATSAQREGRVTVAPKIGQTPDQEARDRYECYRFAVTQTGFDPLHSGNPTSVGEPQSEYARAQAACFEARGYSVR